MKKKVIQLLLPCVLLASASYSFAQDKAWNHIEQRGILSSDSITKGKFTLIFINKDTAIDAALKQRMTDAFFTVYPKEANTYNRHTAKKVIFIIDPAYDGVAATGGRLVRYNPEWFHKHPEDIDVVTHEVMHIVQAYKNNAGPGWITEGIADYKFGVDNAGAGWKLPEYSEKQNYDKSYRITARFFVWIEQHYNKDFVTLLDSAMRTKKYKDGFAKQHTGKSFSALWLDYSKNPAITPL